MLRRRRREHVDRAWQEAGFRCMRCGTKSRIDIVEAPAGRRRRLVLLCVDCARAAGLVHPGDEPKTLIATRGAWIPFRNGYMVINAGDRVGASSYAAKNAPKGLFAKARE